jgi:hypothetical protein
MKFKNIYGREVNKNIIPYIVNWQKKVGSNAQTNVKKFFAQYWAGHIVCEEFPVLGSKMRCDLINFTKKIAIETHGQQHDKFVPFFHKNRTNFKNSCKRDLVKHNWLELNGFKVIEIFDNEIKHLTPDWVKEKFGIEII